MSRLTIAFVLALAATAASAQGSKSDRSQTLASANETRPFLFDGRMKDDGTRRAAPADRRHPNGDIGVIIMPPKASQPARNE